MLKSDYKIIFYLSKLDGSCLLDLIPPSNFTHVQQSNVEGVIDNIIRILTNECQYSMVNDQLAYKIKYSFQQYLQSLLREGILQELNIDISFDVIVSNTESYYD